MDEMQPESDARLLREYAEHNAESAFTELVQRHTNLVYSAALRQVESPDIAAEIAQNVFVSLARGAKTLAPGFAAEASLAGWLCRSARNLSLNHRRDEFRRLTRERLAMEQLDSTPVHAPDWEQLRRVLDDAMAELNEADYDALVLRFYQNQDFRTVGAAIGVSDDTAQKRVTRALDKLRDLLAQRGIRTTAGALGIVITANAVQAAPMGLAVTISTAALAGTAATASTIIAATTKTIAMTTLQKTLVTATVAVLAGAGIYEARQTSQLRDQVQTLQQQQAPMAEHIQQLQAERNNASNGVASLKEELARVSRGDAELLELRSEATRFRRMTNLLHAAENPANDNPGDVFKTDISLWKSRDRIKFARIKERLNLSAEQSVAIEGVITNWFMKDREDRIKALLSPEQQIAYHEFKNEDAKSDAGIMTKVRVDELTYALALTEEQKDKVFSILNELKLKDAPAKLEAKQPSDAETAWAQDIARQDQFSENEYNALTDILSPAQLDNLHQMQSEDRKKMLEQVKQMKTSVSHSSQ
jgi:RNA polymerase sigma factor (sigma-70 family)